MSNTATKEKEAPLEHEILTLDEGASFMRLGVESMREVVERGDVPALRLNHKHTVMLKEDLIDFVRKQARQQQEERRRKGSASTRPVTSTSHQQATKKRGQRRRVLPELPPVEVTKDGQPA